MKKNWRLVIIAAATTMFILAALNSVSGNRSSVFAQQGPIVGGYADTSNSDPEVVAAARFAVHAERQKLHVRIALLSIKHAEVQVVAGLNYRLCLKVKIKGKTRNVNVVVYKNLKQKYSLTIWSANGCKKQ
jgi:Aspartic acid proteinase inhibitor